MIRRPPRSPLFPSTPLSRPQIQVLGLIAGVFQAQVARRDDRALGHDDRALDAVFQLAHIPRPAMRLDRADRDRKSTRLNSSHDQISYAVFCLKKKKTITS